MGQLVRGAMVSLTVALLIVITFTSGLAVGRSAVGSSAASPINNIPGASTILGSPDRSDSFRLVSEVWGVLQRDFVEADSLKADKAAQAAVKGLIESIGDSHTTYLTKEELQRERDASTLSYEGIGASVRQDDQKRLIVSPFDGSPAKSAGMRNGDWIMAVDGKDLSNSTIEEAVRLIRGPRGTKVRLTVLHENEQRPVEIEVTRGEIRSAAVSSRILPEGFAYIRIAVVTNRAADELKAQIPEILKSNPKGIILDLRNNPGGVLDTTIELASQFLKDGVVLEERDRNGNKKTHRVRSGGQLVDLPLVVLVNKNSASASEVISGALQDYGRATVIGESTFGKGTVNLMRELNGGEDGAVYVSIARWYTPKGRLIEGKGISPDISLALTEDDVRNQNDAQLQRAIDVLSGKR